MPNHIGSIHTMSLILRKTSRAPINLLVLSLGLGVVLSLTGCQTAKGNSDALRSEATKLAGAVRVYVPDVVQGNVVSQEQKQALRLGMRREQIRDILGTPLVASVLHESRWDYVFTLQRQDKPLQRFVLTLHFEGDVLKRMEGDDLPSESELVGLIAPPAPVSGKRPALHATQEQLQKHAAPTPAKPDVTAPVQPPERSYPPLETPLR
jgi:outer membrane protein assembly factor BamE